MISNLLVLIGLGLFLKVFFKSAEFIKDGYDSHNKKRIIKTSIFHIVIGVVFIVIGRFYVGS